MNDMLAATTRSDPRRVDALMKQTEFPDYARYMVSTYQVRVAPDWAEAYRRWLGENEDHLRELLETVAKDEDEEVLVRKANEDPLPGRGVRVGNAPLRPHTCRRLPGHSGIPSFA
jgi:hypothetical protein